jgi:hypothetical protein
MAQQSVEPFNRLGVTGRSSRRLKERRQCQRQSDAQPDFSKSWRAIPTATSAEGRERRPPSTMYRRARAFPMDSCRKNSSSRHARPAMKARPCRTRSSACTQCCLTSTSPRRFAQRGPRSRSCGRASSTTTRMPSLRRDQPGKCSRGAHSDIVAAGDLDRNAPGTQGGDRRRRQEACSRALF